MRIERWIGRQRTFPAAVAHLVVGHMQLEAPIPFLISATLAAGYLCLLLIPALSDSRVGRITRRCILAFLVGIAVWWSAERHYRPHYGWPAAVAFGVVWVLVVLYLARRSAEEPRPFHRIAGWLFRKRKAKSHLASR